MKLNRLHIASLALGLIALVLLGATVHDTERTPRPLYHTVFLKPGETQAFNLSAPGNEVGAGDRTFYDVEFIDDKGAKVPGLKGVRGEEDRNVMGQLFVKHQKRFITIKLIAADDAEPGMALVRIRAKPFGGTSNFETTMKIVVAK